MNHRLFSLQEFLLTYFHEDWMLDDPTTESVAERFVRATNSGADRDFRETVIAEIRDLLRRPLSEDDLHSYLLDEYSTCYDPWMDERTTREWLEAVLTILTAADPAPR